MMRPATEKLIAFYAAVCAWTLMGVMAVIVGYLFHRGWRSLGPELVFGSTPVLDALFFRRQVFDGLFPAMAGTIVLVVLAVGMAIPVGIAAGVYMAEYARGGSLRLFNLLLDILAGVPSILVGLFGFSIAVFLHRFFSGRIGPCLLVSAVSLSFLVLPYIIRTTQSALEGLPETLRKTALALGASRFQNITRVLLPQALSGIASGVILSIGRCAEDTAVILLTGVVASAGVPRSLLGPFEALPFYIYYISSQYTDAEELARGYGAAIVLLALCLCLYGLSILIKGRVKRKAEGGRGNRGAP